GGRGALGDVLGERGKERARQHPQTTFAFSADKLMPGYGEAIDLTVYRCVQESLTNVVRHARATRAEIALSDDGGRLALTVRDDGCGIDAAAAPGFGIRGMQERVQALGGSYRADSERGRGTCVRIVIPLAAQGVAT